MRPRTRGECKGGARPCPYVSCRHHLYLDVNPTTGTIKFNYPGVEPDELVETCSLDVADRGEHDFDSIMLLMNTSSRQVVTETFDRVVPKLKRKLSKYDL